MLEQCWSCCRDRGVGSGWNLSKIRLFTYIHTYIYTSCSYTLCTYTSCTYILYTYTHTYTISKTAFKKHKCLPSGSKPKVTAVLYSRGDPPFSSSSWFASGPIPCPRAPTLVVSSSYHPYLFLVGIPRTCHTTPFFSSP